jgi:hypothetical protein
MFNSAYNRIISICHAEIVTIRRLQVAMEYSFQGISGDEYAKNTSPQQLALQRIQCQLSEQECYPLLEESDRGVTSPLASQPFPGMARYIADFLLALTLTMTRPAPWHFRLRQLWCQHSTPVVCTSE